METIYLVQSIAAPWLDVVMTWVTDLGSEEAYIALLIVAYLAVDARTGRTIGIAFLFGYLVNQHAKGLFDTERPFDIDPEVVRTERALAGATGPGFPSGHAQASSTFWGLAAALARRPAFTAVALVLIALITFSRLYLGVHVPIDLIGGLALGGLTVAVTVLVVRAQPNFPTWLLLVLGVAVPFVLHLLAPTAESDMFMGGVAAFVVGPMVVRHRTDGPVWGRVAVALIGLLLAFTVLVATSQLLPEEVKRDAIGGFVRFLALGLSATLVAPWIGKALGLVPGGRRRA